MALGFVRNVTPVVCPKPNCPKPPTKISLNMEIYGPKLFEISVAAARLRSALAQLSRFGDPSGLKAELSC
jgi:hypothetical protein